MKHLLTLTILCFGLLAQAQIPSYVPTNGLVGWWPFNGNANDESGNGNNAVMQGNATFALDRYSVANSSYSGDLTSGADITALNNFPFGNSGRTISIWFQNKMPYPGGNRQLFSYGDNNSGGRFGLFMDGTYVGVEHVNGARRCTFAPDGNWHNIVVTYPLNGAGTNDITIYFDGRSQASQSFNPVNLLNTANSNIHWIGTLGFAPGWLYAFSGKIDDIAIYNRALSASEVQQLYLGSCAKPTFTTQPQNKSVAQGQTTTFAVQVDSASRYLWQMNLGLGAGWANIPASALFSGDTTSTLSVQGRSTIDGAQFRCIVTACKADTSNAATLTVSATGTATGSISGVPGKVNYQAVALNASGVPVKNRAISVRLSILDSASNGTVVYAETHQPTTDNYGQFSIYLGGGNPTSGTFGTVNWANNKDKFLKAEADITGGTNYILMGTSQMVSVPYALVSGKAMEATTASFLRDNSGNAYQLQTVNGQPSLVTVPGSGSSGSFACGQSVTYAGEIYPTVQIGNQCWFQKNLNVGTMILGANDQTNNSILEKYCYNNDPSNCAIFGGLYQWAEAVQYQNGASNTTSPSPAFSGNIKGICPTGWHVPLKNEVCALVNYLDPNNNCNGVSIISNLAGAYLKDSKTWQTFQPNVNQTGFSAKGAGMRKFDGQFDILNLYTYFWTTDENQSFQGRYFGLYFNMSAVDMYPIAKETGFSLRCIKD